MADPLYDTIQTDAALDFANSSMSDDDDEGDDTEDPTGRALGTKNHASSQEMFVHLEHRPLRRTIKGGNRSPLPLVRRTPGAKRVDIA